MDFDFKKELRYGLGIVLVICLCGLLFLYQKITNVEIAIVKNNKLLIPIINKLLSVHPELFPPRANELPEIE